MTATMTATTLTAAKQKLRQQMKRRLASLPPEIIALESAAIFHALWNFSPYVQARRVAVFLSMPAAEVQTDAIVRHALAAGKQVFVPYLHKVSPALAAAAEPHHAPARVMDMVQLHDAADYMSLTPDRWGIPSVSASSVASRRRVLGDGDGDGSSDHHAHPLTSLDLILLPGVAFDVDRASGRIRRCGHGKGFYDYFLHRYKRRAALASSSSSSSSSSPPPVPPLYGLALAAQVLPGTHGASVPTDALDHSLDGLIAGDGSLVNARQV